MGACGDAPVLLVNNKTHVQQHDATTKLDQLLRGAELRVSALTARIPTADRS